MKKIATYIKSKEAHKLIGSAFLFCFVYILFYELLFTRWDRPNFTFYKLGVIASKTAYSIIAASIFYLISQYIPIYLPRQIRKRKVLYSVHLKTDVIGMRVDNLKFNLGVNGDDFYNDFDKKVNAINPTCPVEQFENWYLYLFQIKTTLIDLIRSIAIIHDNLSFEYMDELSWIEYQLSKPHTFEGRRTLACDDLSYAQIQLQEIIVHNKHLQELKAKAFVEYADILRSEGEAYMKKYYSNF
jgi:hypothetical protein